MDLDTIKKARKVIGAKQTAKAIDKETAAIVLLAGDADKRVTGPLLTACQAKEISVEVIDTMDELGKLCAIEVGAAAAAVLRGSMNS